MIQRHIGGEEDNSDICDGWKGTTNKHLHLSQGQFLHHNFCFLNQPTQHIDVRKETIETVQGTTQPQSQSLC